MFSMSVGRSFCRHFSEKGGRGEKIVEKVNTFVRLSNRKRN